MKRAGEGNRTLVFSLEGYCSTVELHPRSVSPFEDAEYGIPVNGIRLNLFYVSILWLWKWGVQDSNLRRRCHQIYSLTPLTARETPLHMCL